MEIEEKIKAVLSELSGEKSIEITTELQGDLALDSLAMITLLMELENAFDIQLDESDMNPYELKTVQSVIDMIKKYKE